MKYHSCLCPVALLVWALPVSASPPKKGVSVCAGTNCNFTHVPLGLKTEETPDGASGHISPPTPYQTVEDLKPSGNKQLPASSKLKRRTNTASTNQESRVDSAETNLPSYYQGYKKESSQVQDTVVYVPPKKGDKLAGVHTGDIYKAVIEQEILVSAQVKQPIRAILISGPYKGSILVGEATLDSELKRVLLDFNKIRIRENRTPYLLKSVGLSRTGTIGLNGEYHSEMGKFFVAEALSAFAAAALDSTIQRNQNAFGGYAAEPSLGNSAKAGTVTAISKTTDRFAEQVRSAPEFTSTGPWQEIQVLIQEEPKEEL